MNVDPKTVPNGETGDLPGFKDGGGWRFLKADLDAWIAKQKAATANKPGGGRSRTNLNPVRPGPAAGGTE